MKIIVERACWACPVLVSKAGAIVLAYPLIA